MFVVWVTCGRYDARKGCGTTWTIEKEVCIDPGHLTSCLHLTAMRLSLLLDALLIGSGGDIDDVLCAGMEQ